MMSGEQLDGDAEEGEMGSQVMTAGRVRYSKAAGVVSHSQLARA